MMATGPSFTHHDFDVIPDIEVCLFESRCPVPDSIVHRFAAEFGRAQIAVIDQFFLVLDVIVERSVGQAQVPGTSFREVPL